MATFDLDGNKIKEPNCTSIFKSKDLRSSNKLYDFETEYGQYTLVKKKANFKKAFKAAKKNERLSGGSQSQLRKLGNI